MRLALLSDVHGNLRGLDACLDDLRAQGGADLVVGAGDYCMDGPRPREVLERLEAVAARCVRGNTDRYLADRRGFPDDGEDGAALAWQRAALGDERLAALGALPAALRFGAGTDALLVVHANPANDEEHLWPDATDALLARVLREVPQRTIAFGHLHLPYVRAWREYTLVNVSSAGLPKDGDPRAGYALLVERSGGWEIRHRRVAFDVEAVVREIERSGMPERKKRIRLLRRARYKELDERHP